MSENSQPDCTMTSVTEGNDIPLSSENTSDQQLSSDKSKDEYEPGSETPIKTARRRIQRFSDSESEVENENHKSTVSKNLSKDGSDSDEYPDSSKNKSTIHHMKKVVKVNSYSESDVNSTKADSDSNSTRSTSTKNIKRHKRIKSTNNEPKNKKKINSRKIKLDNPMDGSDQSSNKGSDNESGNSDDSEISSIDKIKQQMKNKKSISKICDTDTSDEENAQSKSVQPPEKQKRSTLLTSPKPQRMSAKQAKENMSKIKSESNRMLREKDVSLPYHRPKALSLKDIMNRRKPAVSSDGKALPIKMNGEQLKQYALMLQERQKEMMELCKSDTEEEDDVPKEEVSSTNIDEKDKKSEPEIITSTIDLSPNEHQNNTEVSLEGTKEVDISNPDTVSETEQMSEKAELKITEEKICEENFDGDNNESNGLKEDNLDKSEDQNESAEMQLVYNDSVEEETDELLTISEKEHINTSNSDNKYDENKMSTSATRIIETVKIHSDVNSEVNSEKESQLISLQYDEDTLRVDSESNDVHKYQQTNIAEAHVDSIVALNDDIVNKSFESDEDMENIDMDDIDMIIANAEIVNDDDPTKGKMIEKPKLTGAPGMIINLDDDDPSSEPKLTGMELLKQRFTYFAKLKTPEEKERDREKSHKPGTQHKKLKQELEEKIAEQRSLEWAKRLEGEKQKNDLETVEDDNDEDNIEKIEAMAEDIKGSSSESEEELVEDDIVMVDKPRKSNPLLDDEAEESDSEENKDINNVDELKDENDVHNDSEEEDEDNEDEDSSDDEDSSESECEIQTDSKPKKGRILKAFEDSDDEETIKSNNPNDKTKDNDKIDETIEKSNAITENAENSVVEDTPISAELKITDETNTVEINTPSEITESQDDVLQLAQVSKNNSEEILSSPSNVSNPNSDNVINATTDKCSQDVDLGSQTFSILNADATPSLLNFNLDNNEKLSAISDTQSFDDNLDAVVGMCSGSFTQNENVITFNPSTQSQITESQVIGESLLGMCTGKFYDNQFVSQVENDANDVDMPEDFGLESSKNKTHYDKDLVIKDIVKENSRKEENDVLKSVLNELNDAEFDKLKPMKYFVPNSGENKENAEGNTNTNIVPKKKFVIDSDDEMAEDTENSKQKKKKFKKKKPEKRALQISDDEDESELEGEDDLSEDENIDNDEEERLIEYDSEENEVVVKPQKAKKRRGGADFFEQEAELTSEDEWVGSGDEDERGLDRLEREEGDDDTFNQGQLQAELGQIHMRDVLDQDKREVRLIQELLFEDGDLGGGGRQRKFRWRNADGEEETGTTLDFGDSQEEEFESEEQWRKQRHEREMFLRQLKNSDAPEEPLNITVNRTSIIKANLSSKTMTSLLEDANRSTDFTKSPPLVEEKTAKDAPGLKKPFSILQQNYHGSLLTRGRGALARLAALATPLALDDDVPKVGNLAPTNKRNFVFAALTPQDKDTKVNKRKAEANVGTPQLVKKMKTEESKKQFKSSLLDHFRM